VTERSDLYSLGALLYEMLCGRPPFTDENATALIAQHIHARPAAPSEHNRDLPPALDALILRLLAKAPEERPPSAAAVGEELRRIAGDFPPPKANLPVPPETSVRGLRRLWANRTARVAAAVLALGVIGGGVAGGMFVSGSVGGSGPAANPYRRIDYHWKSAVTLRPVGGDCETTDLVLSGQFSGDDSGDITGAYTGPGEVTLYASDQCQWGYLRVTTTLTDQGGNTLSTASESPYSVPSAGEGLSVRLASPPEAIMYTGGTGIYEGATGHGRCVFTQALNANLDDEDAVPESVDSRNEGDCTGLIAIGPDAADTEPVILELGAGLIRMTVFSSAGDLPKKAYFNVLYMNTRNEPQTGLSLTLRAPEGAEIIAAARDEEEPASAGERVWALPDLAPREVGRLQFSVTFLSAEAETVDLIAEIDGDGLAHPSRSDPLAIEIVQ
jgi:hypothetical protein